MHSEKVKQDSVTVQRGCRGGRDRGRMEKPSSSSGTSVLDGTKRSETWVEVVNSGNTPRKEQASGDQGQNGAGSNTSKEADALGKIITPQPTKTEMSFKFEPIWDPNYLVHFSKQNPSK